jgi:signal transduction histidine kinase
MLQEILFVVIVLVVATLMIADVARTRNESFHGHGEGQAFDAKRPVAAASVGSVGSRESFSRAHVGPAMPVAMPGAVPDAGPARPPAGASPSAGANPRSHEAAAVPRGSRRRLRDRPVRSRLVLLVTIPLAAAVVIAVCVSYIIDVLRGPQISSNGSVLSALAAGIVIIVAALASLFTIAVARSVLQPLSRLRMGALELTGARLADAVSRAAQSNGNRDGAPSGLRPIDVDASDELGEIARAFDELRRELLRLAVGESAHHGKLNATFVDLSHRGQSLMERQIRLLQHLEQGEPSAERLTTLFRVQRIGNRMHRYSGNLLILIGHEPSGGWNQPIALGNIIRTAVSELEEHQRVSVSAQPDVAVVGPAVNDVVHLLIELAENATSFSAADMQVDISGRVLTSGGVLLEITDRGVGMTPKELAYANWQLENPPTADANIPKSIGLLVVARLAVRHGIGVRLQPADFGGLTALVWLPDAVLTEQGAMAARFGGLASAGSRRGLHEAVPHPGYATAQEVATARFAPSPGDIRETRLDRRSTPDAGRTSSESWSPAPARSALRTGSPASEPTEAVSEHVAVVDQLDFDLRNVPPGTAAPLSQDTSTAADGVIVPPSGDLEGEQRLPVFNAVESRWFREGRSAPGSPGQTSATGSRWSSPADVGWRAASAADSPSSAGSTAAGLPVRRPNANLVPGTIPSAEPVVPNRSPAAARERLASLRRGVDKGRAATRQAASPGDDEEARPGSPD